MAGTSDAHNGLILRVDLNGVAVAPQLLVLRHAVRRALAHIGGDFVVDAELVATELVTNAAEHGAPPIRFRLCQAPNSPVVRIEVDDGYPASLPQLDRSGMKGRRGFGLVMVDRLTRDWGFSVTATSKTVWAEMIYRRLRLVQAR